MKRARLIPSLLVTVSLLAIGFSANTAYADNNFYIEIGHPASIEKTNERWLKLSKKYSYIRKLTFYPKTKIDVFGETSRVIQAGPIFKKRSAQRTCKRLFARKIPCFVIEGVKKAPPSMSIRISQITGNPSKIKAIFPWQIEDAKAKRLAKRRVYKREAKVAVAEAIPVPLTKARHRKKMVFNQRRKKEKDPFLQRKSLLKPKNYLPREFISKETGGLVLGVFSSEGAASKFWNNINKKQPRLTSGLRARVQQTSNSKKIRIKVYPFPNGETAAKFCNKAIKNYGTLLKCNYSISNSKFASRSKLIKSKHANSYSNRRKFLQRRLPSQQIIQRDIFNPTVKKFWVQVAIGESRTEANNRWKEIRKANRKIVRGLTSKMTTSSSSTYARYTIRLGTLKSERKASALCGRLQLRGVDCLVISTSK